MDEEYKKACTNLIENYSNYLADNEIEALKNLLRLNNFYEETTQLFLNNLIDRIWNLYLTNPEKYEEDSPFHFLVVSNYAMEFYENENFYPFTKQKEEALKIITDETILKETAPDRGYIVEINYFNNKSVPLLPNDILTNPNKRYKCELKLKGLYNINFNTGLSFEELHFPNIQKMLHVPLIIFNKPLINKKHNLPPLNNQEVDALSDELITDYSYVKNIDSVKVRKVIAKSYNPLVKREYLKYLQNKITLEEYIKRIYALLDKEPDMPGRTP